MRYQPYHTHQTSPSLHPLTWLPHRCVYQWRLHTTLASASALSLDEVTSAVLALEAQVDSDREKEVAHPNLCLCIAYITTHRHYLRLFYCFVTRPCWSRPFFEREFRFAYVATPFTMPNHTVCRGLCANGD